MKRRDFLRHTATAAVAFTPFPVSPASVIAGPDQGPDHSQGRRSTAARVRQELQDALMETLRAWFPRCLDTKYGGFLCDFDTRWKATGPYDKTLEYQARQTRAAAQAALYDASLVTCREAAEHGFRYLKDRMWDDRHGGWYRKLGRTGRTMEGETKHGHGTAYAIQACIEYYRLTGNPDSLRLAHEAFRWLEEHAHDSTDTGYFSFYQRDGTPILSLKQNPLIDRRHDKLGTPIGLRDENTALDLLEAFADLYSARPDSSVRERLLEMSGLCVNCLIIAPGLLQKHYYRDWSPAPSELELGISLQAAMTLLKASAALGDKPIPGNAPAAQLLVDSCLRFAWDRKRDGFYGSGKIVRGKVVITSHAKDWWAQAEGLRALLAMARLHNASAIDYADYFQRQWKYARKYMIDSRHGGWNERGLDTARSPGAKAHAWKDSSHEVRALIQCIQILGPD